ncbi:MAG: hypothetical protein H3C62_01685 [Gemmatimonadaceae bacterium]|nr:hypothetical protein [Gemmatimonadaceae bacterium]
MTNDHFTPRLVQDDGDAELTSALRQLYAAPDAPFYWSGLEQRIMERIARDGTIDTWWSVPTQWVRVGLIAAGFALIVAGSLMLRARAEQRQMAYESVLGPANGGPTIAIRDAQSERQATLNYINGR